MISGLSTSSLCASAMADDQAISQANFDKIKGAYGSNIFVLSKSIKDATWENYKVYGNQDSLKNDISSLLISKGTGVSKVLVLIDPTTAATDTVPSSHAGIPASKPEFVKLTQLLNHMSDYSVPYEQRKPDIDKAMSVYFTNDFSVVMHADAPATNERDWDGHGKDYLDRLTVNASIIGFYISSAYKSKIDGKISRIELVEYHNQ
jgi:hypothetical protein